MLNAVRVEDTYFARTHEVESEVEPSVMIAPGMPLADIEKLVILETLRRLSFNRTRAARTLGIGIRTLQRKIKQYQSEGLAVPAN